MWRKVWAWSGVRQSVTWGGVAFAFLILTIGLAAFASANNLLFLVLAALLSTMLVSGLVSRLSLAGLELKLLLPDHVFARRRLPARLQLHNSKSWMSSFSIQLASSDQNESPLRIYFPVIPAASSVETLTTVYFSRRGIHGNSQYQFMTRFPFGFTERRLHVPLEREVLVYPSIDPRPGMEGLMLSFEADIAAGFRGRGADFYRIRPYESNESVRHVDWKSTAHTGALQVREFVREEDYLVEVFLDLALPGFHSHHQWLERAIDCCAYLAWRLAERNVRLRFVTQTCDLRLPESASVYTILEFLARAEPSLSAKTISPHEESSFQIVFSLSPQSIANAGWRADRLLAADAFDGYPPEPSAGSSRSAPH
ncbi:MAG: DUF58 domain-containing protein [Candidatus Solibacter usitatus]|nr:DUF58 domain-containing protein [Candidatus Solibacter usitatus]